MLAFEELEACASARGDVSELVVVEPELANGRRRVAAADHAESVHLGERLRDRASPGSERRKLEHAHRPVPEHRARSADVRGEGTRGLGADVETEAGGTE